MLDFVRTLALSADKKRFERKGQNWENTSIFYKKNFLKRKLTISKKKVTILKVKHAFLRKQTFWGQNMCCFWQIIWGKVAIWGGTALLGQNQHFAAESTTLEQNPPLWGIKYAFF